MPVVWTGYGAAAYEALRGVVGEVKGDDPLAPVSVLVPTHLCGVIARRVLAWGVGGRAGVAGLSVLTVDRLAELIAAPALTGRAGGRRRTRLLPRRGGGHWPRVRGRSRRWRRIRPRCRRWPPLIVSCGRWIRPRWMPSPAAVSQWRLTWCACTGVSPGCWLRTGTTPRTCAAPRPRFCTASRAGAARSARSCCSCRRNWRRARGRCCGSCLPRASGWWPG